MNNNLLKYINEFFNTFKKDHTFYIDGNQIKFCKTTDIHILWDIGRTWSFLLRRDINAVTIEGASLTITARSGRKYTFIATPKSKEEMAEEIILLLRNKLTRIFYEVGIKENISEITHLLDELERINKE